MFADAGWAGRLTSDDRRALTPLFWSHINPYGRFDRDMDSHISLGRPPPPLAT